MVKGRVSLTLGVLQPKRSIIARIAIVISRVFYFAKHPLACSHMRTVEATKTAKISIFVAIIFL